jgi:hypothetical protein
MAKTNPTRKAKFLAALDLAGVTGRDWAASQGVDYSHLYRVLTGERESARLVGEVDAFIAAHAPARAA